MIKGITNGYKLHVRIHTAERVVLGLLNTTESGC